MLKSLKASYYGFDGKLSVGEIMEYEGKKYVVIEILKTTLTVLEEPTIISDFIGQEIGVYTSYERFSRYFTFTQRFNISESKIFANGRLNDFYLIGDLFVDYKEEEQPIIKITGIKSYGYENFDLIITYTGEIVQPWERYEMDEAIHKERLATFKVISVNNSVSTPGAERSKEAWFKK